MGCYSKIMNKAPLTCPHCGNDELTKLTFRAPVYEIRNFKLDDDGNLAVDGNEVLDYLHQVDMQHPQVHDHGLCEVCRKEFPLPEGIDFA